MLLCGAVTVSSPEEFIWPKTYCISYEILASRSPISLIEGIIEKKIYSNVGRNLGENGLSFELFHLLHF